MNANTNSQLDRIEPTLSHDGSDLGKALDRALRADIALIDLYHGQTYRRGSKAHRRAGEALDAIRVARRILMALDEERAAKEQAKEQQWMLTPAKSKADAVVEVALRIESARTGQVVTGDPVRLSRMPGPGGWFTYKVPVSKRAVTR